MAGSCKIHGISVGRERDDAFVMFGIDTAFGQFGTLPNPLFIFFREEYIIVFQSGNVVFFITRCFIVGRSEIEYVIVASQKHGGTFAAA